MKKREGMGMKCTNCGKEMPAGISFCTSCGTKLVEAKKFCPNCGVENPDDSSFCYKCGTPLSGTAFASQQTNGGYRQVVEPQHTKQQKDYQVVKNKISGEHDSKNLKEIIAILQTLGNYSDAPALLESCKAELLELEYQDACQKFEKASENKSLYKELEKDFAGFGNYKESEQKYSVCKEYCDKQRRKAQKTGIIIFSSLIAATAIVVLLIKVIIPAVTYNAAMKALAAGEYEAAVAKFETLVDYKDSSEKIKEACFGYGKELVAAEYFDTAITMFENADGFDSSIAYKEYATGRKNLNDKKYSDAITCFTKAKDIEDGSIRLQEANYLLGDERFKNKSYSDAIKYYTAAGNYKDAADKVNASNLMTAEDKLKNGFLNEAKAILLKLPTDYSYNGISVKGRLEMLESHKALVNACGKWTASYNYIETRNVYKRDGSWDSWYYDTVLPGQSITIKCRMNNDATFTIEGTVTFERFTDYSSLSSLCNPTTTTKQFAFEKVNGISTSYSLDNNTTLKYSNGTFSISFSEKDNYSSYFYNLYKSSVTFGTRSETY